MADLDNKDRANLIKDMALEFLAGARDSIIINMRFMDVALNKLPVRERENLRGVASDGAFFYYDPEYILNLAREDVNLIARSYLHSVFHSIFNHSYEYETKDTTLWDLACDIAIESMIMELNVGAFTLKDDDRRSMRLLGLRKNVKILTAQRIYRHFVINGLSSDDAREYTELFRRDLHIYFGPSEDFEISLDEWKKISERIKTDLQSFSKNSNQSESLIKNLVEAQKEKTDYKKLLTRFTEISEESSVNDDEFDYIYYSYGIHEYGNIPLIEPLEYKDVKKIRDFAIVIDTSASCQGDIVKRFLNETYKILKSTENFFKKINIHIIQCDQEVRSDTKINCDEDFKEFIERGKLIGYGGTDFRPAFEYVDGLIEKREFNNLRGMIYFTDGYGIYPVKAPEYDTMFVFLSEDERMPEVPWWGIRVVLESDDLPKEED